MAPPLERNQAFLEHFHRTERLFKRYQPWASQWDAFVFAKTSFYGTNGRNLSAIASLSCREGGFKRRKDGTRNDSGWLGGHKPTILAGSKILDGKFKDPKQRWKWLNKYPTHKCACLSAQFEKLVQRFGEEEAIRRWVKGENWKCKDAELYYKDVLIMKAYYER